MARVLNLKKRKNGAVRTSILSMQPITSLFNRDVVLTAIVVIPASIVWVVSERMLPAIIVAGVIAALSFYSTAALRDGKFDVQPIVRLYRQARELIRSRTARRA